MVEKIHKSSPQRFGVTALICSFSSKGDENLLILAIFSEELRPQDSPKIHDKIIGCLQKETK